MIKSKKKILCTLGPASFNEKTIVRLEEVGVSLFRINLSHTKLDDIEDRVNFIRRYSSVSICLDSEGAQIRTGFIGVKEKFLKANQKIVLGNSRADSLDNIPLYPAFIIDQLAEGDLLSIDFDSALIRVISIESGIIRARVISSGWVGSNKAVTSLRQIELPAFTQKDIEAIEIGNKLDIKHYALSFANTKKDVETMRRLTQGKAFIISKIESQRGYKNLDDILSVTDAILIDRGDLSREIKIEQVPFYQKKIVSRANQVGKPVYIATNLLESMIEKATPTRAEVHDVINSLAMGADGLVLAAETAIGKRPVQAASMVVRLINQFNLSQKQDLTQSSTSVGSLLVEPHGGELVQRWDKDPDWGMVNSFRMLEVSDAAIMDCEQIAVGTYSPLEGFMDRIQIDSVLDTYKLVDGAIWTLPIVLQQHSADLVGLTAGQMIALSNKVDKEVYATLKITDIYKFPFESVCKRWFGTLDQTHPGVIGLKAKGDCFIGGEVTLVRKRRCAHKIYNFTPQELRHIFDSKGWSRVVGFHTRNVVHRGHEALQKIALERTHCDGLLVSPVIGEKKKGDFASDVLLKGYQVMLDGGFLPPDKAFIGAFATYSRYSGAREAVFTALCRKNFGCSHFIIGRDHTGVGKFYPPTASQQLFYDLGDIGIIPVMFDEIKFCPACDNYVAQCTHIDEQKKSISGTAVRDSFVQGVRPPTWMTRGEISDMVLGYTKEGREIFV
ncbi:MAG: sulfate adenylyltransferase [Candidatus Omnitrophica bacterium]|nr:sulfate adenylyltransferase [Candidatus Omnitrophota bacterium]